MPAQTTRYNIQVVSHDTIIIAIPFLYGFQQPASIFRRIYLYLFKYVISSLAYQMYQICHGFKILTVKQLQFITINIIAFLMMQQSLYILEIKSLLNYSSKLCGKGYGKLRDTQCTRSRICIRVCIIVVVCTVDTGRLAQRVLTDLRPSKDDLVNSLAD